MGSAIPRGQKCPGGQGLPESPSTGVAETVPPAQVALEKCGPSTRASAARVAEERAAWAAGGLQARARTLLPAGSWLLPPYASRLQPGIWMVSLALLRVGWEVAEMRCAASRLDTDVLPVTLCAQQACPVARPCPSGQGPAGWWVWLLPNGQGLAPWSPGWAQTPHSVVTTPCPSEDTSCAPTPGGRALATLARSHRSRGALQSSLDSLPGLHSPARTRCQAGIGRGQQRLQEAG